MDGPGEDLLAGTRFSVDQQVHIAIGQFFGAFPGLNEIFVGAYNVLKVKIFDILALKKIPVDKGYVVEYKDASRLVSLQQDGVYVPYQAYLFGPDPGNILYLVKVFHVSQPVYGELVYFLR